MQTRHSLSQSQPGSQTHLGSSYLIPDRVSHFRWSSTIAIQSDEDPRRRPALSPQEALVYPHLNISLPFADDSEVNIPTVIQPQPEPPALRLFPDEVAAIGVNMGRLLLDRSENRRPSYSLLPSPHNHSPKHAPPSYHHRNSLHVPDQISMSLSSPRNSIASRHSSSGVTSTGSAVGCDRKQMEPTFFRWNMSSFRRKRSLPRSVDFAKDNDLVPPDQVRFSLLELDD